jgi:hypothetical protein
MFFFLELHSKIADEATDVGYKSGLYLLLSEGYEKFVAIFIGAGLGVSTSHQLFREDFGNAIPFSEELM